MSGCYQVWVPQGSSGSFSGHSSASELHLGRNFPSRKKDLKYKDGFLFLVASKYLVSPRFCYSSTSWHIAGPTPSVHRCHHTQGLGSTSSLGFRDHHESPSSLPCKGELARGAGSPPPPKKLKIRSKVSFCLVPFSAAKQMFRVFWQGQSLI